MIRAVIVAVALLVPVVACAPRPKVGACDMPATTHEGFALSVCGVRETDETDVCCGYVRAPCYVVVCARGCGDWRVEHRDCAAPAPATPPMKGTL